MTKTYHVPAGRHHPTLPLGLAWLLWLTSKHVVWPGWVWGVVWTLYALILIVMLAAVFMSTAYDTKKMDRILGEDRP